MGINRVLGAVAVALCGVLTAGVAVAGPAVGGTRTAAAAPYCGLTWGSAEKAVDAFGSGPLIATRTGQHACFDRVVFEFDGPATGYRVFYGEVYTGGEGMAMSPYTAGGALLHVELLNPAYAESGATYPHRLGDHVANVVRYQTLRDVVYAGSYEGYSTFAVGVRARLPFQVSVLAGPGTHSRIVVDVAHAWQA
ncbi:MAG TPA: hypothetical protein VK453_23840 [Micromonosporaceae bacterium]|nr:hypothetical protein [Micromonosporaceae bacterium]